NCNVPTWTSATITVNRPIVVSVVDTAGNPIGNLGVTAIDGVNPNIGMGTTNPSGQVTRSLPSSTYQFRVTYGGTNFFSNPTPNCAVPGCTSATITVNLPVTVTVVDGGGVPQPNLVVSLYNNATFVQNIGTTNASGQVTASIPSGSYRFRVTQYGQNFYSAASNDCTVPGCTTDTITVTAPTPTPVPGGVQVTVVDSAGNPQGNLTVFAVDGGGALTNMGTTNSLGQVTANLAANTYRFRTTYNGTQFFSNATPNCAVPGCTTGAITVNVPTTVTVTDDLGNAQAGLAVTAIDGVNPNINMGTTNALGQVTFSLPSSTYQFRVTYNGTQFFSNATPNCAVPGCSSASITVQETITVTVVDSGGNPQNSVTVQAYNGTSYIGMGVTNAAGQAIRALPSGSYYFRALVGGTWFQSGATLHCTVPGCTSATITVNLPVTVTVVDDTGAPVSNVNVQAFDGAGLTNMGNTLANGQVTRSLAASTYSFRATYGGTNFWSNATPNCTVPGCSTATVTVNRLISVTVVDNTGAAIPSRNVAYVDGAGNAVFFGTTNSSGVATGSVPSGTYRFRVTFNGTFFYSNPTPNCAVPGCTNGGTITVNQPTTVTVVDVGGVPQPNLTVIAIDGVNPNINM